MKGKSLNTLGNDQKFLTQRSGMTHARWRAVQHLPTNPRVFHASTRIEWRQDPRSLFDKLDRPPVPRVARYLGTYNAGRNAAKRARRGAKL